MKVVQKTGNKIKSIQESRIFGYDTLNSPLFGFTVLLGLLIGLCIGVFFSRKLINMLRRDINYIRGLFG
ncbi:putative integral membrane protein [Theileria parva strain Muguga]|uniref:putative integral membrane protein n=1 Tax=Theileria parva strain Muguga TaxID=333668 RepID=UPI001C623B4C|nr:putative integral membrane protein [Theileria parva strain Muguga]KAF5153539.1 putative integral membrane protein [Theileria parva strain Muguga]